NREKLLRVGILDDVDGGVAFDASASHAAIQTSKPLEIMWVVMGPEGSKYAEHVVGGPKLEVEPDELGAYGVFLVLKDERDACSLVRIMFGVTHNEPYAGRGPVRTFTE